jgi:hypothetical protein
MLQVLRGLQYLHKNFIIHRWAGGRGSAQVLHTSNFQVSSRRGADTSRSSLIAPGEGPDKSEKPLSALWEKGWVDRDSGPRPG